MLLHSTDTTMPSSLVKVQAEKLFFPNVHHGRGLLSTVACLSARNPNTLESKRPSANSVLVLHQTRNPGSHHIVLSVRVCGTICARLLVAIDVKLLLALNIKASFS